jgi:hypothetical protein
VLGNKRALELHQDLLKLLGWLAGDEHGREELAPSGGGHGGEEQAVARGGARGGGLNRRTRRPWMTRRDGGEHLRATALGGARTAATSPSDWWSAACARVRRR